jgi:hypothetical protein
VKELGCGSDLLAAVGRVGQSWDLLAMLACSVICFNALQQPP